MRILAIDTSCGAASVAIVESGRAGPLAIMSRPMARGHAEALALMVEEAMRGIEGGFPSLARIAVAIGPGSFTGIRVGLAMARAMGVALAIPVVGVLESGRLRRAALERARTGIIASTIDARHGSVYFQLFEASGRPLGHDCDTPGSVSARSARGQLGSPVTPPRSSPAKPSAPDCLTISTLRESRRTLSLSLGWASPSILRRFPRVPFT